MQIITVLQWIIQQTKDRNYAWLQHALLPNFCFWPQVRGGKCTVNKARNMRKPLCREERQRPGPAKCQCTHQTSYIPCQKMQGKHTHTHKLVHIINDQKSNTLNINNYNNVPHACVGPQGSSKPLGQPHAPGLGCNMVHLTYGDMEIWSTVAMHGEGMRPIYWGVLVSEYRFCTVSSRIVTCMSWQNAPERLQSTQKRANGIVNLRRTCLAQDYGKKKVSQST